MMKKIIVLVVSLFLLTACTPGSDDHSYQKPDLKTIESFYSKDGINEAEKRYGDFGFDLIEKLYKSNENEIISPYSLFSALALLANGSAGETRQEFENVFQMTVEDMNQFVKEFDENNHGQRLKAYEIANGIWLNNKLGLNLSDDFLRVAEEYYRSGVMDMDFSDKQGVADTINDWAKQNTNGAIDQVVDKDDVLDSSFFFLANAMAAGGKWYFEPLNTRARIFHNGDGTDANTLFMNRQMWSWWHDDYSEGFVAMLDNMNNMVAILPNEDISIEEYLKIVDGDVFRNFFNSGIEYDNIDEQKGEADIHISNVSFPKFSYEKEYDLMDAVSSMGLSDIFDYKNCDFSALATGDKEKIDMIQADKLIQKADIFVDEKEVRAAAVTVVEMGLGSAGYAIRDQIYHDVVFDRPFLFAITSMDGTPLFIGVVSHFDDMGDDINISFSGKIEVIADNIKIRKEPGLNGQQVGNVKKGDVFYYQDKVELDGYTWYQIGTDQWIADDIGEWVKEID